MASSNAALMLALGVMLTIVSVADWQMNSPMINARTGCANKEKANTVCNNDIAKVMQHCD